MALVFRSFQLGKHRECQCSVVLLVFYAAAAAAVVVCCGEGKGEVKTMIYKGKNPLLLMENIEKFARNSVIDIKHAIDF